MKLLSTSGSITAILLTMLSAANAQTAIQYGPDGFVEIEEGANGLFAGLDSGDRFSRDHDVAGDINGDGVLDLVVGARSDDDGQTDAGAAYILFLNTDGTVQSNQKISALEGGFNETLNAGDFFGYGVAGIGDYDKDGIPDIAVSALSRTNNSLYIIHLNRDGTVKSYVKNTNIVAQGLTAIGDINGDGRIDLVACDPSSNDGGTQRGAIRILFLNDASEVVPASTVTISSTQGGFGAGLSNNDRFGGREVAMLGDLDGDGSKELAVGAFMSDGGKGAIWILSLDATNYNVVSKAKITEGLSGFSDILVSDANPNGTSGASFGHSMCAPGDLNGDGVPDLITGANQQNEGWGYILYLNADKTVKTYTRINNIDGGFGLELEAEERFSRSISFIGDLRQDGTIAVNMGGGAGGTGKLYLLFFKPCSFNQQPGSQHWNGGNTLFTNWNHQMQMLTSDSMTFEQCTFKAFETDAPYMTYNFNDGRCICKDSSAVLAPSTELSTAFINECFDGFVSTSSNDLVNSNAFVYPNPTNSKLTITTTETSFSGNDRMWLYNTLGELLYVGNVNRQQTSIDLSAYPSGLYFLHASIGGVGETFRVVKD
ncbi:FG-GAP-like repeat-containing protein [Neolewinella persica]|uniref:FG-GAP-like repeat-containing protein n=1 Tax=Neolewinella persica TaxID=70998 RepID=UPI0003A0568E|nr:FG-GAP-like repeat-containing protein [Neolewinella persica]